MRVLVYELNAGGHYLHWAGSIAAALSRTGAEVTLAVSEDAPRSPSFLQHVAPHSALFQVDASTPASCREKGGVGRVQALRRCLTRTRAERLYLPTADGIAQTLGLWESLGLNPLFKVPTEALIMNGAVAHLQGSDWQSLRQRASYELAKRGPWTHFSHLSPLVHDWEANHHLPPEKRIRTMPEPIEQPPLMGRRAARQHLQLDENGAYFGMAGRITERKGADLLTRALQESTIDGDARLVLFGPFNDSMRDLLKACPTLSQRVVIRDEHLSDVDLQATLEALDLVVLPYRGVVSSSGLLTRAIAAQTPVLTTQGGWGQYMVEHFDLGWIIPTSTPIEVARGVAAALSKANRWQPTDATRRFLEYNHIDNFVAHWTQGIRPCMGLDPSTVKSWEWAKAGSNRASAE